MPFTTLSLAIPYETEAGEAVFMRIEVWRLGAKLIDEPEVEYLRLSPRLGFPDLISEQEYRAAIAPAVSQASS